MLKKRFLPLWHNIFQVKENREGVEDFHRRFAVVAISTAFFTALAHGFLFTNEFFSHDSITYFDYTTTGFKFYLDRGRFLIPVYEAFKGNAAAPWLIGALFLFWMILTGMIVTQLLDIRTSLGIVLACGLLCTNVSMTLTGATYIYCLDEYAFALFCAALSAPLFLRGGRFALVGMIPLFVCLAIYQPYATVAALLCLLVFFRQAAYGRQFSSVVSGGLACLTLLILTFLLYRAAWMALVSLAHVSHIRDATSIKDFGVLFRFLTANLKFLKFFFWPEGSLGLFRVTLHVCLFFLFLCYLFQTLSDSRLAASNRILLFALFLLLPTAFYSIALIEPKYSHDLTAYGRELVYFLPLSLLDAPSSPHFSGAAVWARRLVCVLLALLLYHHVVYANQAYMKKELEKNSTLILAARIVDRIEAVPGYVPGETHVAFAGSLDQNASLDVPISAFADFRSQTGLWHAHSATHNKNIGRYLTEYLRYPLVWDTETNVTRSGLAKAMPTFPEPGSVRMIDGVVVVKLSD